MKRIGLRKILTVLLTLSMVLSLAACSGSNKSADTAADDTVYELKLAHVVRPTTPKGAAAEEFKRIIEEKSNGRIKVSIYPDSQMGTDQEINEQILSGALDMNTPLLATLTSFVSEFELFDLPYLFTSSEEAFNALNGEVGEKFNAALEEKGLIGLGYWTGGFKQITNSVRPVKNVADLSGLKIRVSQSPILVSQFRAINAGGISVPFSELYSALQTKAVDGQENPYANIASKKFYEVQKYMTISDHGFMGYAFIMNKNKFDSMPEDLQAMVKEAAKEATEWEWEKTAEKDVEYLQEIKDAGMVIDEFTDKEKAEFKEATKSAYDEFSKMEKGPELLEAVKKYVK
ncbi:C4-dicarboxylate-binding protein DctP [Anaerosolibacter carboniphilus]|uniref:C4-dicarboxylate-binding protein DctP n=1 Tax=Anaerosolibacter carboniphilus TaxID=1417629 RepID=A0A841KUS3_9FIRM|nr:TRAP transporter substrate-binding protein [Anaerosolibacter carboniphilus]MBB6217444.1 C4-dicarboxylate-binding protein DctP [Anaerosolibacter carboniphilus]